jgi:hypothetical protein
VFCQVPGHIGLHGNKAADGAAEAIALHKRILTSGGAVNSDVCAVLLSWQDEWTNDTWGIKLHMVKPSVQAGISLSVLSGRRSVWRHGHGSVTCA